jgi:S1-C subfamily serine protease
VNRVFGRWLAALPLASALAGVSPAAVAGITDTIERVKPAVVAIGTFQRTRSPAFKVSGTGFAVADGSLVATNAHVIPPVLDGEQQETMAVQSPALAGRPAQMREAKVLAVDKNHDVALLRISGAALPPLALQEPGGVREGQTYAFTGFPIGSVLGLSPVTHRAMISAITPIALPTGNSAQLNQQAIARLKSGAFSIFQLDGTAYPGNSGSPLYDPESGEVVGILNMVFVKGSKESGLTQPSGISFAIPIEYLQQLLRGAR